MGLDNYMGARQELRQMIDERLADRLRQAPDLATAYEMLLRYPGLGRFLAFQYAIDLNYAEMLNFSESEFVVAGPGAIDGISKCFEDCARYRPEDIIQSMAETAEHALEREITRLNHSVLVISDDLERQRTKTLYRLRLAILIDIFHYQ